jgi:hypothetical protein
MPRVVPDPGLAGDDRGQAREGPQVRAEPEGPGALPQGHLHRLELVRAELRLAARPPSGPQRGGPAPPPLAVPAQDALAADAQPAGDLGVSQVPGREQPGRRAATLLQGFEIPSRTFRCMHTRSILRVSTLVTIFYEIQ